MNASGAPVQLLERSCAIGLDVGGTKIAAGLVDAQGLAWAKRVIPTLPGRGAEPILRDALELARDAGCAAQAEGWDVAAVGVGLCELVGLEGSVLSGHTIPWRGLPIQERFAELAPSLIESDSRAAALCEARCGAGQPFRSILYVTIGTGIGGSLVIDGLPFPGAHGCAGTLASSPMAVLCPVCGEVRESVLEEVASGPAILSRYNRRAAGSASSAEEVLAAAARGNNEAANWTVNTAVQSLGAAIGLLVNVLDPHAVIIGGGLGSAKGVFWERLPPMVRQHIWSDVHRTLPILQASRGSDSGWIGAGLLALEKVAPKQGK